MVIIECRVGYTSRLHDVKTEVHWSAFRRDWRGNYDDSLRDATRGVSGWTPCMYRSNFAAVATRDGRANRRGVWS